MASMEGRRAAPNGVERKSVGRSVSRGYVSSRLGYRKRTSDMGGNRFAREEVGTIVGEGITVEVCGIDKISVVDNDASYLEDDTEEYRMSKGSLVKDSTYFICGVMLPHFVQVFVEGLLVQCCFTNVDYLQRCTML